MCYVQTGCADIILQIVHFNLIFYFHFTYKTPNYWINYRGIKNHFTIKNCFFVILNCFADLIVWIVRQTSMDFISFIYNFWFNFVNFFCLLTSLILLNSVKFKIIYHQWTFHHRSIDELYFLFFCLQTHRLLWIGGGILKNVHHEYRDYCILIGRSFKLSEFFRITRGWEEWLKFQYSF